jgi:glutamine amidotransferase
MIIDYQLGNLFSVRQACLHLGYEPFVSSSPDDLAKSDFAILPGVGAYGDAMKNLDEFGLTRAIRDHAAQGKPLMGVCLGLQLLLTGSEEFGQTKGLDLIPGVVRKFPVQHLGDSTLKVPQIQWNTISEPSGGTWSGTPLDVCQNGDHMYFVHSYYAEPADPAACLSMTEYGNVRYCSSVNKGSVFATQFHPEKSGEHGIAIYRRWFALHEK